MIIALDVADMCELGGGGTTGVIRFELSGICGGVGGVVNSGFIGLSRPFCGGTCWGSLG